MGIKDSLLDPHGVLENWDGNAVDPCSWNMVTWSPENLVIGLGSPSQKNFVTLSASIGNLTNLQIVLLQNNNISGPIPSELGRLSKLRTLDLSNNFFTREIPPSLSHLRSLQYLRLKNNSISGQCPESLANMTQLAFLDLSFNNISGLIPKILAKSYSCVNALTGAKFEFDALEEKLQGILQLASLIDSSGWRNKEESYKNTSTCFS